MDKYDEAIAYLKENPHEIEAAWGSAHDHIGWPLFQYATKSGDAEIGSGLGCLTLIRNQVNPLRAETDELTLAIRADDRIPGKSFDITVETLPVFAEWQRKLDKELNRV